MLLSKENNLKSRLKGIVGDKFDDAMNHWENTFLSLVQNLILQKEDSEKKLLSSISTLDAGLAKIRKENGLLVSHLAHSRDRAQRRYDYLAYFKDMEIRNRDKAFLRQVHLSAEVLINEILLSNSFPLVSIKPLEVNDDEIPHPADSNQDYSSGEENDFPGDSTDKQGISLQKATNSGELTTGGNPNEEETRVDQNEKNTGEDTEAGEIYIET